MNVIMLDDSAPYVFTYSDNMSEQTWEPEKEACYRAFLYCALTLSYTQGLSNLEGTLDDLIRISKDCTISRDYETFISSAYLRWVYHEIIVRPVRGAEGYDVADLFINFNMDGDNYSYYTDPENYFLEAAMADKKQREQFRKHLPEEKRADIEREIVMFFKSLDALESMFEFPDEPFTQEEYLAMGIEDSDMEEQVETTPENIAAVLEELEF